MLTERKGKLIERQMKDMARVNRILSKEMRELAKWLRAEPNGEGERKREAVMGDVLRISQAQIKVMAVELQLLQELESLDNPALDKELSDADWHLLEGAIRDRKQHQDETMPSCSSSHAG